ncbi:hypothetical protein HK102_000630 [Quaeritorhiza haematococci]|nr:hypothetical protein HK102_000630 [Quaeritorhiza haematococci]
MPFTTNNRPDLRSADLLTPTSVFVTRRDTPSPHHSNFADQIFDSSSQTGHNDQEHIRVQRTTLATPMMRPTPQGKRIVFCEQKETNGNGCNQLRFLEASDPPQWISGDDISTIDLLAFVRRATDPTYNDISKSDEDFFCLGRGPWQHYCQLLGALLQVKLSNMHPSLPWSLLIPWLTNEKWFRDFQLFSDDEADSEPKVSLQQADLNKMPRSATAEDLIVDYAVLPERLSTKMNAVWYLCVNVKTKLGEWLPASHVPLGYILSSFNLIIQETRTTRHWEEPRHGATSKMPTTFSRNYQILRTIVIEKAMSLCSGNAQSSFSPSTLQERETTRETDCKQNHESSIASSTDYTDDNETTSFASIDLSESQVVVCVESNDGTSTSTDTSTMEEETASEFSWVDDDDNGCLASDETSDHESEYPVWSSNENNQTPRSARKRMIEDDEVVYPDYVVGPFKRTRFDDPPTYSPTPDKPSDQNRFWDVLGVRVFGPTPFHFNIPENFVATLNEKDGITIDAAVATQRLQELLRQTLEKEKRVSEETQVFSPIYL